MFYKLVHWFISQGEDFDNKVEKGEQKVEKGEQSSATTDKKEKKLPQVAQKFSKIRVEPEFSGNDVKSLDEEKDQDASDMEAMSDEDESVNESGDEGKELEDSNNSLKMETDVEVKEECSNTRSEASMVECDSSTDIDKTTKSSRHVVDSKNIKRDKKGKNKSDNRSIKAKKTKHTDLSSDKRKVVKKESKEVTEALSIEKEETDKLRNIDKYTPSRKRQFKTTTSGSFVVEDLTPAKKKKDIANPTGM